MAYQARVDRLDLVVPIQAMPAGTGITEAYVRLVKDGLIPPIPEETKAKYRQYANFQCWAIKNFDGHLIATGKHGRKAISLSDRERAIIAHIERVGIQTVRSLFYAMLGLKLVEGSRAGYQDIIDQMVELRERWFQDRARGVDPDKIVDESCEYDGFRNATTIDAYLDDFERGYYADLWANQPKRVEIWLEKGTIIPLLRQTFWNLRVQALPTHGFLHWGTAHRIAKEIAEREQPVLALYYGDWDPSGLAICGPDGAGQIAEMMEARLRDLDAEPSLFTIRRMGLTLADTRSAEVRDLWVPIKDDEGALERSGGKKTKGDVRAKAYEAQYGKRCWEVDALASEPERFKARITADVEAQRNKRLWVAASKSEGNVDDWLGEQADRMRDEQP